MAKFYFLHSTDFKLLSQTRGNSVNDCRFFKFIISLTQGAEKPSYATVCACNCKVCVINVYNFSGVKNTELL